jgi:transposase InsO family protein
MKPGCSTKLHVIGQGPRKRYLYVAIDRASRMVHLAVKDEETEACASAFLKEALAAFPFAVIHILTDCPKGTLRVNGSCFTADAFQSTCRALAIEHRRTKPRTPRTNGMVERFNGRIGRKVLVMCVGTHDALERLLQGYNLQPCLQRPPAAGPQRPLAQRRRPRAPEGETATRQLCLPPARAWLAGRSRRPAAIARSAGK